MDRSRAVPSHGAENWEYQLSGEPYRCTERVLNILRHFPYAAKAQYQSWQTGAGSRLEILAEASAQLRSLTEAGVVVKIPKLVDGHIASGPTVGAAATFAAFLKQRDRSYLALEMEAAGVLQAVNEVGGTCQTAVLRGISDLADERKKELDKLKGGILRTYAMENVLSLLWSAMAVDVFPRGRP